MRILLVKNPAGANEVLRTLALEPGEHDLLGVLNDKIADGRDVSWVWDADFELLAGRVRSFTCAGTRAAELATRIKYAGVDASRIHVQPELHASARRGRAPHAAPAARCMRCRPTRRCSSCASCSSRRGEAEQLVVVNDAHRSDAAGPVRSRAHRQQVVWHDLECGGYRADLPLWRELAGDGRGPAARRRRRHRPRRARAGRRGRQVTAVERDDELLLDALRERAVGLRDRGRLRRRARPSRSIGATTRSV